MTDIRSTSAIGRTPLVRPIPAPPSLRRTAPAPAPPLSESDEAPTAPPERCAVIMIRPWTDPVVDEIGHDPRSRYVEQFWLGVLGPTATWLTRRFVAGLERDPSGYEIDLAATAQAMGLSYTVGRSSPFAKALQRCTMFGIAHHTGDGLAVRRRFPDVTHRHLRRMPAEVQAQHEAWQNAPRPTDAFTRAHRLAVAMIEVGDEPDTIEHRLVALGVADVVAAQVADNAARL